MKLNRTGQAAIINPRERHLIRDELSPMVRMIFDIGWYTGERWGAIIQLKVSDVFDNSDKVRDYVTFRKETRKHSAGKVPDTRQVKIHPDLKRLLQWYEFTDSSYLFPSPQDPFKPVSFSNVDSVFKTAIKRAGLADRGISTHSTRRTFITNLYKEGVPLAVLKKLTGHKSMTTLMAYIEVDPDSVDKAVLLLK